jgi:hypothetical protein
MKPNFAAISKIQLRAYILEHKELDGLLHFALNKSLNSEL